MLRLFLVFLISLAAPAFAAADDPLPVPPELKAYLSRPQEEKIYYGMMKHQWQGLFKDCEDFYIRGTLVTVEKPPVFDSAGEAQSGAWKITSNVEGCGYKRRLNVQYVFDDKRKSRILLLPGTTITDFTLQHDSLQYAAIAMTDLEPADCTDIRYSNTEFVSYKDVPGTGKKDKASKAWDEQWTLLACGVTGVVTMHYIPDAAGTTIMARPSETVKVDTP